MITDEQLQQLDQLIRLMIRFDMPEIREDDLAPLAGHLTGAMCVWAMDRIEEALSHDR